MAARPGASGVAAVGCRRPHGAGALPLTNVYHLAIDPTNSDVVLAATGNDGRVSAGAGGIYRSTDGCRSWQLVHQFVIDGRGRPRAWGSSVLRPGPRRPDAGLRRRRVRDRGQPRFRARRWSEVVPNGGRRFRQRGLFHVVAGPSTATDRRVYAFGGVVWVSPDGGSTWHSPTRTAPGSARAPQRGATTDARGVSAQAAAHPSAAENIVYVARADLRSGRVTTRATACRLGAWTQLPVAAAGAADRQRRQLRRPVADERRRPDTDPQRPAVRSRVSGRAGGLD